MSIQLKSSDDQIFTVDIGTAQQSVTIKTMLEVTEEEKGTEDEPIPLPNVSGSILKVVLDWCNRHKDDPPYIEDEHDLKRTDDIIESDKDLLKVENSVLFELILAANYLDIKGLLDVGCKTVANMIKGKTAEEIRKTFDLETEKEMKEKERKNNGDEVKEKGEENEPKKAKKEESEQEQQESEDDSKLE